MITAETKRIAVAECAKLCGALGLDQVYLAEIVGARRHYLAGYGRPAPGRPRQIQLTYTIAAFWHGELPPEKEALLVRCLCPLTNRIEKELAAHGKRQHHGGAPVNHKGS